MAVLLPGQCDKEANEPNQLVMLSTASRECGQGASS